MKILCSVLLLIFASAYANAQVQTPITSASCIEEPQGLYCQHVMVNREGNLSFRVNPPEGQTSDISLTYVRWVAVKAKVDGFSDNSYSFDADSPLGHFHMFFHYQWGATWSLVYDSGWIQGK